MAHNQKTKVFAPTQDARLKELLMLFGCGDEIAPFDADALATRAGELIAKVTSAKALTMVVDVQSRISLKQKPVDRTTA